MWRGNGETVREGRVREEPEEKQRAKTNLMMCQKELEKERLERGGEVREWRERHGKVKLGRNYWRGRDGLEKERMVEGGREGDIDSIRNVINVTERAEESREGED